MTTHCRRCGALCDHESWDGVNCPWCMTGGKSDWYMTTVDGDLVPVATLKAQERAQRAYAKLVEKYGFFPSWGMNRLHDCWAKARTITARIRLAGIVSVVKEVS